jgi:hypothetical protein
VPSAPVAVLGVDPRGHLVAALLEPSGDMVRVSEQAYVDVHTKVITDDLRGGRRPLESGRPG